MQAKLLNLEESLQMYELISKFIDDPKDISQFAVVIGGENYIKCLELLTGEKREIIIQASSQERLIVLADGFTKNRLDFLPRLKTDGLNV